MTQVCSGEKPVRSIASSTMAGLGFPMTNGRLPVQVQSISMTQPQSGALPYQVGQTGSGWVAT